jgi:hypothetical protein
LEAGWGSDPVTSTELEAGWSSDPVSSAEVEEAGAASNIDRPVLPSERAPHKNRTVMVNK